MSTLLGLRCASLSSSLGKHHAAFAERGRVRHGASVVRRYGRNRDTGHPAGIEGVRVVGRREYGQLGMCSAQTLLWVVAGESCHRRVLFSGGLGG